MNITVAEKETTTIISHYSPPSANLQEDLEDWSNIPGFSPNLLVLGDFNAHSNLWGYPADDDKGHHLLTLMSQKHLISLNDSHSLATFQMEHIKGWPDVSLVSFPLFPKIDSWEVDEDLNYGDHRLITIKTDIQINKLPGRRYRTKDISFKKLNSQLTKDYRGKVSTLNK